MAINVFRKIKEKVERRSDEYLPLDTPSAIAHAMAVDHRATELPFVPEGPHYDLDAQCLALAAPLSWMCGEPWNSYGDTRPTSSAECGMLLEQHWDITTEAEWHRVLDALLAAETGNVDAYRAARVRRRDGRSGITPQEWAAEIDAVFSGVEAPETVRSIQAAAETIIGIEGRLRQIGMLGANEEIAGLDAYDYVPSITIARWGAQLGLSDERMVATTARRAACHASQAYSSWREFGLGMIAGCVATHPELYNERYVVLVNSIRPLLDSRMSPWNNIPFPSPEQFAGD